MTQSIGKKSEKTPMQHDSWGVFLGGGPVLFPALVLAPK